MLQTLDELDRNFRMIWPPTTPPPHGTGMLTDSHITCGQRMMTVMCTKPVCDWTEPETRTEYLYFGACNDKLRLVAPGYKPPTILLLGLQVPRPLRSCVTPVAIVSKVLVTERIRRTPQTKLLSNSLD